MLTSALSSLPPIGLKRRRRKKKRRGGGRGGGGSFGQHRYARCYKTQLVFSLHYTLQRVRDSLVASLANLLILGGRKVNEAGVG